MKGHGRHTLNSSPTIETLLLDLSDVSLEQLRHQDAEALAPYLQLLYGQVERPRPNLGGGPPGRAD